MAVKKASDVRVYFGTYDLSTASVSVSVNLESEVLDPTVFTDAAERATAGIRRDTIEWAGLFNDGTSADAAGSAMIGSASNNVISVFLGTATGDRAYVGTGYLLSAKAIARIGELVRQGVTIRPDQAWGMGVGYGATGSKAGTAIFDTGSVDNGTLTTAGGTFFIHILTASGIVGTLYADVWDSADGVATWSNIGAATLVGITTATSDKVAFTGPIRRYTRPRLVGTGTATLAYVLVRS